MRVRVSVSAAIAAAISLVSGCVSPAMSAEEAAIQAVIGPLNGKYDISSAAMATAVLGEDGRPVGLLAYDTPADALKAGDTAAFIAAVKLSRMADDEKDAYGAMILALDAAADNDIDAARAALASASNEDGNSATLDYIEAWLTALDGESDAAIDKHRAADNHLPGLTADLSLAAMLEGFGRTDEALAVYTSLTPGEIEAPEHDFDAQGLLFAHIQVVVSRRTLLLRRLGRIDEAKVVYQRLAEAEPEQATRYAAAMASLESGEGLDDEALTPRKAFARSLTDLSLALYQQRLIRTAMMGGDMNTGYDNAKGTLDQLALLLAPDNETLRENVINGLYAEALYDGAAHVAEVAPEPTAGLKMSAAQSWMMSGETDKANAAIEAALSLADEDERLSTLAAASGQFSLLGNEARALEAIQEAARIADNDSERAAIHGMTANMYSHFGRYDEAFAEAASARSLDDTHDRRMVAANAMAKAGQVNEALAILRKERLGRPNDPYMLNTLGYFLISHTDKFVEGFKVLARANAMARNDPYISDSYGWAHYMLGDYAGARRYVEASRDQLLPQSNWEIDDHLGDIYWRQGHEDMAREAWRSALAEFPSAPERQAIEAKLSEGLTAPAPEKQPLPDISLDDDKVNERDI